MPARAPVRASKTSSPVQCGTYTRVALTTSPSGQGHPHPAFHEEIQQGGKPCCYRAGWLMEWRSGWLMAIGVVKTERARLVMAIAAGGREGAES